MQPSIHQPELAQCQRRQLIERSLTGKLVRFSWFPEERQIRMTLAPGASPAISGQPTVSQNIQLIFRGVTDYRIDADCLFRSQAPEITAASVEGGIDGQEYGVRLALDPATAAEIFCADIWLELSQSGEQRARTRIAQDS